MGRMWKPRAVMPWIAVACAVVVASCGGGGGESGGSPTAPVPAAQVGGTWSGTAEAHAASGTCLADGFTPLTVPVRWVISQAGATFTADETLNNRVTCPFRGSIVGSVVTFFGDPARGGADCWVQKIFCPQPPFRPIRTELQTDRALITMTVSGNRMSGAGTSVWRVFDANTGELLGEFRVESRQELTRQ